MVWRWFGGGLEVIRKQLCEENVVVWRWLGGGLEGGVGIAFAHRIWWPGGYFRGGLKAALRIESGPGAPRSRPRVPLQEPLERKIVLADPETSKSPVLQNKTQNCTNCLPHATTCKDGTKF